MIQSFLSALRISNNNDVPSTRRNYPRRDNDRCVVMIHGRAFPVENWSYGGLMLAGEERLFALNQEMPLILKFKLRNTILEVEMTAQVVRKSTGKIALRFTALSQAALRSFNLVIDDAVAREFAKSQATA